ncbi:MAG: hypothetical protein K2J71_01250, partial [Oscillospiraceae bacterium]|nr:hypothetical protein [Oscillospiraceae bacterium]
MKKSFLSRAMSAALAVPFALSQTILCASFAVDDTAVDESALQKITIDDFKKVPTNEKIAPIKEVEKYVTYEQSSPWNQKLQAWASSQTGDKEIALDVTSLADSVTVNNMYGDILREVLSNPEYASAVAKINTDEIVVTLNLDYPYATLVNDMLEKKFAEKYPAIEMGSFDAKGTLSGTIVLTASTESLNDYTIPFDVKIITPESEGKGLTVEGLFDYAESTLKDMKKNVNDAIQSKLKEFQSLKNEKQELKDKYQKEKDGYQKDVDKAQIDLDNAKDDLKKAQADLDKAKADLDDAKAEGAADLTAEENKVKDAQAKLEKAEADANSAQKQLDDVQKQLNDAQDELNDAQRQLDDAQEQLDEAKKMAEGEVNKMIDPYVEKLQAARKRFTNLEKSGEKTYHAADVDDLIQQVKADAKKVAPSQSNRVDKVPDELDDFTNNKYYAQFADFFAGILKQVNDQAEVKAYEIDLDADAVIDFAEEVKDITVTVSGSKDAKYSGKASGEVFGYLDEEEDLDIAYYYTYFNELFAPENKKVVEDSIKTEKRIEASGDVTSDTMSGNVKLEVKRIITLEVEDLEETTTSSTDVTETTTSSFDPSQSSETTTSSFDPSQSSETTTSSFDPSQSS